MCQIIEMSACSEELVKAQEEIASLNAIREKLESDMVALQQQMEEAIKGEYKEALLQ